MAPVPADHIHRYDRASFVDAIGRVLLPQIRQQASSLLGAMDNCPLPFVRCPWLYVLAVQVKRLVPQPECLKRAESAPTRVASGRTGVRAKAAIHCECATAGCGLNADKVARQGVQDRCYTGFERFCGMDCPTLNPFQVVEFASASDIQYFPSRRLLNWLP